MNSPSPPKRAPREPLRILLLVLAAAVLFSVNLGGYDAWPPDEPRFAEVAREMIVLDDYLVPRINGEPYREKPPLLPWLIVAASWPGGEVTAATARVPSVLAGILTVLLTYLLARRLFSARTALWAAIILGTMQRFWWQARFGQIDMLLTACLTLALYVFLRWHEERRYRWLVVFYLALTAALYAKGPGVLVFPALFLLVFYWRQWRALIRAQVIPGFLAVGLLMALWVVPSRWAAAPETQAAVTDAVASNLFRQTIGRFLLGVSHAQPPWYYLETLPVDWLPWALFLPWTLPWVWQRRKSGYPMRFLLCWIVPAFVFFSIAAGKRGVYLLPLFPAFAILFAASILELAEAPRRTWRRRTAYVWSGMLIILAVAPLGLRFTEYAESWRPGLWIFVAVGLLLAASALIAARRTHLHRLHEIVALHFAVLAVLCAYLIFPVINDFKSVRSFCTPVRRLVEAGESFELYSFGFTREEYIFYAQRFHTPVLVEPPDDADPALLERAALMAGLREGIAAAVAEVPVADIESPAPEEIAALRQAVDAAFEQHNISGELRTKFEELLAKEVDPFLAHFASEEPVLVFVQEADWRWVVALFERSRQGTLLRDRQVGSREVLLAANPAAAKLAGRVGTTSTRGTR